jgi:ElaB/YqjD/DUF883 family membrane-anchored ribosome-binding protein
MIIPEKLARSSSSLVKADVNTQLNNIIDYLTSEEVLRLTSADEDKEIHKIQGRLSLLVELKELRQRIIDASDNSR